MESIIEVSTIQDQIEYGNSVILNNAALHVKEKIKDSDNNTIIHNSTSYITKYWDILQNYTEVVNLTDEQYNRYRRKPRLLSLENYGTIELWSAILLLNNMTIPSQFTKRRVRLFTTDVIEILEEILILEDHNIRVNKDYIESTTEDRSVTL